MKYTCLEGEEPVTYDFTLGHVYESMGLDAEELGLDANKPAYDISPMQALSLVNKWNRESNGACVYYLEENPQWL